MTWELQKSVETRALLEVGVEADSAPCRIFSMAQKRQQISTRNFQYLLQHQFGV